MQLWIILFSELHAVRLNLSSWLESDYTLPTHKSFISDINHKFEKCKDKLKSSLESEARCVSLTTDIWTTIAN